MWLSIFFALVFMLMRMGLVFSFAPDIGGVESNVLYSISKVLAGGALYDDPESKNFAITQYGPVYYELVIKTCHILGYTPPVHVHEMYVIGRLWSFIFNLLSAWLIFRILFSLLHCGREFSIIASSLFLIHLTRIHFAARPDALFAFLFAGLLYACAQYLLSDDATVKNKSLNVGLVISAFSLFVKQTGIEFFFILPGFFFFTFQFRRFFQTLLWMGVTAAFLFLLFKNLYEPWFVENTFGGLKNGISLTRTYDVFSHFFQKYQLFFVLGILYSLYFFDRKATEAQRFFAWLVMSLFIFALGTGVKEGSWINYYNEFMMAVLIAMGLVWNEVKDRFRADETIHYYTVLFFTVYILIIQPTTIAQKFFHEHLEHLRMSSLSYQQAQQVSDYLSRQLKEGEYFLSFDENLNAMLPLACVVPNKDLVPLQSGFNYTQFHAMMRNHQVKFVILPLSSGAFNYFGYQSTSFKELAQRDGYRIFLNE
jgi:hypothetical protein